MTVNASYVFHLARNLICLFYIYYSIVIFIPLIKNKRYLSVVRPWW